MYAFGHLFYVLHVCSRSFLSTGEFYSLVYRKLCRIGEDSKDSVVGNVVKHWIFFIICCIILKFIFTDILSYFYGGI